MATAELTEPDVHDDHSHDHPEWLAHHFETPEQQFDAGKLGIWLFLAQEVLFFTGLFVAYAVYRMNHPEVFIGAAEFLNPTLGALNTIVLLASSLAIAWAVRCAQKNQQESLLWLHVFTLACAGLFLGVKVVEYSYKFDEGLYWAGGADKVVNLGYDPKHLVDGQGLHAALMTPFLWTLAIGGLTSAGGYFMYRMQSGLGAWIAGAGWGLFALATGMSATAMIGVESSLLSAITSLSIAALTGGIIWLFVGAFQGDRKAWGAVSVGLGLCFVGLAAGIVIARGIQAGHQEGHNDLAHYEGDPIDGGEHVEGDHTVVRIEDEAAHDMLLGQEDATPEVKDFDAAAGEVLSPETETTGEEIGQEHPKPESTSDTEAHPAAAHDSESTEGAVEATSSAPTPTIGVTQGNFFSIYFAMTGVHAIHILAGIAVIAWIIGRIARGDFSPAFYGPVEYTGLYWHLVDLVWIYLFPLLYLIH